MKFRSRSKKIILILLAAFSLFLTFCGIEDYLYIYPVPSANIKPSLDNHVDIQIPNDNSTVSYFTNFSIFYRIYMSDANEPSPSESNFSNISSTLYSDYNRLKPYTNNDSMGSSAITIFKSLNYYPLALEGVNIDVVLSGTPPSSQTTIFGQDVVIDFPGASTGNPYLSVGSGPKYLLNRYDGSGSGGFNSFEPLPNDRYFVNSSVFYNPDYITNPNINADIADNPNHRGNTYVSMYIMGMGLNPQTFVELNSAPAFIGVFRLPD